MLHAAARLNQRAARDGERRAQKAKKAAKKMPMSVANLRAAIAAMGLDPVDGLVELRKQYADAVRTNANKQNVHAGAGAGAGIDS